MGHLGSVISFVARLEAIRRALDYDVRGAFEQQQFYGSAAKLWRCNMAAWLLTSR